MSLSPDDLARKVGVLARCPIPVAHIEALETGRARASVHVVHIAIVCRVRAEWLQSGDGPMLTGGTADELHTDTDPPLTAEEARLVDRFRLLPPDLQASVAILVQNLAKPMDPRYRAYEASIEAMNGERGRGGGDGAEAV